MIIAWVMDCCQGFFKEKGPRMAAKVLCDGPFASDYVTGVGFW